ncbi:UNKNOWN [Stylonychia lemnae]|uniref:GT44 domain-containing protein n=1 Tax=Stylonychia lemnae TaxID=5949 RepID=A0A078ACH8_STYLE|nr:UNKNOWN [Stylonychia lemnae]|eukprot:CDW79566.1 UNKNOWN [Stylonychia lemnae]
MEKYMILYIFMMFQISQAFLFIDPILAIGRMTFLERFLYTSINVLGFCYYPRNTQFGNFMMLQREVSKNAMKQKNITKQALADYHISLHEMKEPSKYLKLAYKRSMSPRIPLITHRVYFTNKDSPLELDNFLSGDLQEKLYSTYRYFDDSASKYEDLKSKEGLKWTHYFWVISKKILPRTTQLLEQKGVIVREISESQLYDTKTRDQIDFYMEDFKAVSAATDVIRAMVVAEFGGFYFDNDFNLDLWDYNLHYLFDFYGFSFKEYQGDRFILNGIFGAKKEHPIVVNYLKQMTGTFSLKEEQRPTYQSECMFRTTAMTYFATGPFIIGSIAYNYINKDGNQDMIIQWNHSKENAVYEIKTQEIDENGQIKPITIRHSGRDSLSASWTRHFSDMLTFGWAEINNFN